ncbi:uncharacterized protein HKW66_Vig0231110 [Vigna angularis]|uniref:Uncharacterized protein n=1 Tax=Phaseolus angularis TaxID=3914 RepID=A0A8T0KB62_PHAAN|nr:uncharacterized protein HKW66_Vig0231110 [Vigna angularis]
MTTDLALVASFTYRMSSRLHARCESDGGRRDCGSAGGGEDSGEGSSCGDLGLTRIRGRVERSVRGENWSSDVSCRRNKRQQREN